MSDFRMTLTDEAKREELKIKYLKEIASNLNWIYFALLAIAAELAWRLK